MESKKNTSCSLENKRSTFFQIGLLTVGSLTLAAFTYKTPRSIFSEKAMVPFRVVEFTEEPAEKIEKPEPVIQITRRNEDRSGVDMHSNPDETSGVTKNSGEIPDPKVGLDGLPFPFIGHINIELDTALETDIFEDADIPAMYVGGYPEMVKFIVSKIDYPEEAKRFGDQGTVYVSFVVEKDGSVSNVGIERGVSADLDKEAKRIVRSFPNWIPGEYQYRKVRTRVRLPITFSLAD